MAERAESVEFWKGVVVGTLAGLVAAAYARGDLRRFLGFSGRTDMSPDEMLPFEPEHAFREHASVKLRREASENAGDPTRLAPALVSRFTPKAISIERPTGAPGLTAPAEILEVPGHPGRLIDHSDTAQRVESAARAHNLSSNSKLTE